MRDGFWSWQNAIKIWLTMILITLLMIALMKSCDVPAYDPSSYDRQTCERQSRSATDYANCVSQTRRSYQESKQ